MKWNEINLCSIKTTNEKNKEIIEVGLCKFNCESLKKYDSISLFVKPNRTNITKECTKITGISNEDVKNAISFKDLCDFMVDEYNSKNQPWASYGNFAELMFKKQCKEDSCNYPFSERFLNIRYLFSLIFSCDEVSLKEALSQFEIFAGSNSSEDEVLNLGILLSKILSRGSNLKKITTYK